MDGFIDTRIIQSDSKNFSLHVCCVATGHWKAYLIEKPSLELCRHLVMLRDYNISGRVNLMEIPVLLHMLHFWKTAFLKYDRHHSGKTSSFNLRLILWDAGLSVSNKVLECLVLRSGDRAG